MSLIEAPEEREINSSEKIFEEIVAENCPKSMKNSIL